MPLPKGVIRHRGQVNEATLPNGKKIERALYVFMKYGEQLGFFPTVPDPDHFLYQAHMPVSETDLIAKYHGRLPRELQGPNVACTCGSEGVLLMEGPYRGMVVCGWYNNTGEHKTSGHVDSDGILHLSKKAEKELIDPDDVGKIEQKVIKFK